MFMKTTIERADAGTPPTTKKEARKRRILPKSASWAPYAFLAPTMAAIIVAFLVPAVDILRRSTTNGTIASDGDFVGLQNYIDLVSDSGFWNSIRVTAVYSAGTVAGTLVLGLLLAVLLNRKFRGRGALRTLLIVPWAMPLVPVALIFHWALDPQYGIIRAGWTALGGVYPGLLIEPAWTLPTVIAIQIWRYLPFAALMYLAGLQNIPRELYEAAETDGAGVVGSFRHVTMPGVRTVTTMLSLLITIWSFGTNMTIVFLLTHGGPNGATDLLALAAYSKAFDEFDFGTASTIGTIVLIISGVFAGLYLYVTRRRNA